MNINLHMIDADDREEFKRAVDTFIETHAVHSIKFQRNLYYSLSGSTVSAPDKLAVEEKGKLRENYLAFVLYDEEEDPAANPHTSEEE